MRDRQKQHKSGSSCQRMQRQFRCRASCERGWTVSIKVALSKSINTTLIQAVTSIFKLTWIKQTVLYYNSTTLTSCTKCTNTFPNFAWTAATHNISLYLSVRQLLDKGELLRSFESKPKDPQRQAREYMLNLIWQAERNRIVYLCVLCTHTAVSPVDVEEGEGEKSFVALLWEQLLFKLDKISFKVDHFWCTAISPAQKQKQSISTQTQVYNEYNL